MKIRLAKYIDNIVTDVTRIRIRQAPIRRMDWQTWPDNSLKANLLPACGQGSNKHTDPSAIRFGLKTSLPSGDLLAANILVSSPQSLSVAWF